MFTRNLMAELTDWKIRGKRSPLILRGARQVGKTSLIRLFAKAQFDSIFEINFEADKSFKACFDTFDPHDIILNIEKLSNEKIIAGKTLLFLDEIQESVNAISALRYFKEKMPELHVIAAGSLLE
ncbi:MAG: AAA family ATPase, partial [Coxiella sp. (in: Bacteria)]